jgi:hypothetical protein
MNPPPCVCHGEPQRWNKDPRYRAGGFWKCLVIDTQKRRDRYAADPGKDNARGRRYYHERAGHEKKRRRELAALRQSTLDRLAELHREEERLAVP